MTDNPDETPAIFDIFISLSVPELKVKHIPQGVTKGTKSAAEQSASSQPNVHNGPIIALEFWP